jgi:hypothetical protein
MTMREAVGVVEEWWKGWTGCRRAPNASPVAPGRQARDFYRSKTYRPPLVNNTTRHMTTNIRS